MRIKPILPDRARTLPGLFRCRIADTPDKVAYRHFDVASKQWLETTWRTMETEVGRWQLALQNEGLKPGDRVAIMAKNCREWVLFDQAALGLGLVTVPLYTDDRPENAAYIMVDAGVKLLVVEGKRQWQRLQTVGQKLKKLKRIVSIHTIEEEDKPRDPRLVSLADWVFGLEGPLIANESEPLELATIVYTSGTTGKPKGVMLSHDNILFNAYASTTCGEFIDSDRFLSFLPLSHMLERTAGYYMPMMVGAEVAYARSVNLLADDLKKQKPTILISVPRIYEKVYARIMAGLKKQSAVKRKLFHAAVRIGYRRFEHEQGRAPKHWSLALWPVLKHLVAGKVVNALGGRLRYAVCGGAAMPPDIAKAFLGLGVPILQGYGMTETSPVVSVNRPESNIPDSIGIALDGIEVKLGENDELLTRSRCVMLGYWKNKQATRETIDADGWLHSGDQARIDPDGHMTITGRIKEIIVLGNGEKVPPADMEMAIAMDPLFDQVMVIGEGRSFLAALLVLNPEEWRSLAGSLGVDPDDPASRREKFVEKAVLKRVGQQLADFPGYAQVRRAWLELEPWTVDDGLITPTLKMKRPRIMNRYADIIEDLFSLR
ncbi:MAG TPA: long-chain fatty acid--CoA ligase [Gammaproteobacteria bacterium]|nr:long-chain fatty acid--CoA ligase [Gammaproteobacteria bacterium]